MAGATTGAPLAALTATDIAGESVACAAPSQNHAQHPSLPWLGCLLMPDDASDTYDSVDGTGDKKCINS